ncbi:MAG: DUF2203 domain-containing protein [Planctomycetia bacterium]|nr:MAG: DUF2203 domain-containing protein [Planctomycetia bacterium]
MRRKPALTAADRVFDRPRRAFTVEEANRALVLVRRIVQDVVRVYAELMDLRARREELASTAGAGDQLERMRAAIDVRIDHVNRLQDELTEIGCAPKDFETGLVDFPAVHDGRAVMLCWRLGEECVTHWHEVDAGFSGRRPIEPGFGA